MLLLLVNQQHIVRLLVTVPEMGADGSTVFTVTMVVYPDRIFTTAFTN